MPDKNLHIIAFDIPYPPNYGGVIDVWYKLKFLHKKGVKIILHCYEYPGRDRSEKLNELCERVYYYPRLLGLRSALSFKPYIVSSRRSHDLINNLLKDNHPILFEGLHSCYYLGDERLKGRMLVYRESNIEHRYYFSLFRVDRKLRNKIYFLFASLKLRMFQRVLKHATLMLVVSKNDAEYLRRHFPQNNIIYLPSFHANNTVEGLTGTGGYALYNGNIEVPENAHAVNYLINEVFNDLDIPLVIAGMNPPNRIKKLVSERPNVEIIANPDDTKMFELIRNAHVNILVTFQATGLKLKLLNTLYNGRFCLVNEKMLNGTGLNELCEIANTRVEQKEKLKVLFGEKFEGDEIMRRRKILDEYYSNDKNAEKLIELVFNSAPVSIQKSDLL
jgi:hypothetical protein